MPLSFGYPRPGHDPRYQELPAKEEHAGHREPKRSCFHNRLLTFCNAGLFLISLFLFWLSYSQKNGVYTSGHNGLLKATRFYSPLLDKTYIPITTQQLNISISSVLDSIFVKDPSPEVDDAWARIASLDPVAITAEEVRALGKDPTTAARYPASLQQGLADGEAGAYYVAAPNAMHQLHCLDKLRKDIEFNHYYSDVYEDGQRSGEHKLHTRHCLYTLLQQLLCTPSTEMFVFDWVDGQPSPFPDFGVKQQCLDFDAIRQWQGDHSVPRGDMLKMTAPHGQPRLPLSEDFKRIYELTGKGPPRANA